MPAFQSLSHQDNKDNTAIALSHLLSWVTTEEKSDKEEVVDDLIQSQRTHRVPKSHSGDREINALEMVATVSTELHDDITIPHLQHLHLTQAGKSGGQELVYHNLYKHDTENKYTAYSSLNVLYFQELGIALKVRVDSKNYDSYGDIVLMVDSINPRSHHELDTYKKEIFKTQLKKERLSQVTDILSEAVRDARANDVPVNEIVDLVFKDINEPSIYTGLSAFVLRPPNKNELIEALCRRGFTGFPRLSKSSVTLEWNVTDDVMQLHLSSDTDDKYFDFNKRTGELLQGGKQADPGSTDIASFLPLIVRYVLAVNDLTGETAGKVDCSDKYDDKKTVEKKHV